LMTGAVLVGVLFCVSSCGASGPVTDKRAIGTAGQKTFQIQVKDDSVIGPDKVWVTVTEPVWDKCHLFEDQYPACAH
jgi:hypothetical protein